jgi:hypothetical protein
MPLPQNLDFDKLAGHVIWDVLAAVDGWLAGRPCDETAFINRLTEKLARNRRTCDIGTIEPMTVTAEVAILHRRGRQQTDRYGSDLAVTLRTDNGDFLKTAFFQVKKSQDYVATFETDQLREAALDARIKKRSYALVVDELRGGVRIGKVEEILGRADKTAESVTVQCAGYEFIIQWFWRWMLCEEGPMSAPRDRNCVGSLLQNFVIPAGIGDTSWSANPNFDIPEGYLPARTWMAFHLRHVEPTRRLL